MRTREDPGAWPVRDLLHPSPAGCGAFRRIAGSGPGARRLQVSSMRCFRPGQTVDRCSSPSSGEVSPPPDDLALPWVSLQGASHKGRALPHAAALASTVAGAAPARPRADSTEFPDAWSRRRGDQIVRPRWGRELSGITGQLARMGPWSSGTAMLALRVFRRCQRQRCTPPDSAQIQHAEFGTECGKTAVSWLRICDVKKSRIRARVVKTEGGEHSEE